MNYENKTILVQDDCDPYPMFIDLTGKSISQEDDEFGGVVEHLLHIGDEQLNFKTPENRSKVWSAILEIIRPIDLTSSMDLGQDEKIG